MNEEGSAEFVLRSLLYFTHIWVYWPKFLYKKLTQNRQQIYTDGSLSKFGVVPAADHMLMFEDNVDLLTISKKLYSLC